MKLIIKVARTELRNLFYSPVAWFLTIAFTVQCAIFYTIMVEKMARYQQMMVEHSTVFDGFANSLTSMIFLGPSGIFVNVLQNLFLFVPLLTMGLISREINNGTIKLLYSSPVKTRHIVLGKYLATITYNMLLVCIVAVFVVLGLLNIQHVDTGKLMSSLLGFFLLVCAYTAIGIFMSSVTTYQIVSAIATFTIIFSLTYIGTLWQQYDFVRDLTYFFGMNQRAARFLTGLITTNDLIYFIVIIVMFLGFTMFRLKGAREFIPRYKKVMRYVSLSVLCIMVGYFAGRPGLIGYWDTTRDDENTIHSRTQEIISGFDKNEPLEVTLYSNILGRGFLQGGKPEHRNDFRWRLWEPYLRFKPDIKFNYVTYYDIPDNDSTMYKAFPNKSKREIAIQFAKGVGFNAEKATTPEEVRKVIDLTPEGMRVVMQLKYKGRTTFLRTFNDGNFWPGETEVSAAFLRLQQEQMPKVLFTSGNLERSVYKNGEREYFTSTRAIVLRSALVNVGFDVDTINLDEKDIPAGISSLVIADPKTEMSALKIERIRKYIANGGNTFILAEPGKAHIVNPLLVETGTEFMPGTVIQLSKNEMPHIAAPILSEGFMQLAPASVPKNRLADPNKKEEWKATRKFAGSTAIRQLPGSSFTKFNVFQTDPAKDCWIKMGQLVTDSVAPVFAPQEGDFKDSSFTLMCGIRRNINNKEQRILLSGDADYFSYLRQDGVGITLPAYSWLDNNRLPNFATRPSPMDLKLSVSAGIAELQTWIFLYIIPAVLLILSIILLVRRKRK